MLTSVANSPPNLALKYKLQILSGTNPQSGKNEKNIHEYTTRSEKISRKQCSDSEFEHLTLKYNNSQEAMMN